MAKKRIKRNDGKGKDQEPNSANVDHLSELPDNIIHYILSFVPTVDVIRMSILSKRWRGLWYSLPVLNFDDFADFGTSKSTKLCEFVGKCFTLRKNDLLHNTDKVITKVKLCTEYSWKSINYWLRLVARSNVKELELRIPSYISHLSPLEVLCSSSLIHMRLQLGVLDNLHSTSLPSLISLKLENVLLGDQVLHNLLLGCSSLVELFVKDCYNSSNRQVSSSSPKFLEINSHYGHNFCGKLRNLMFYWSALDDQWLEDLLLRLTFLESLTLDHCSGLRHVKICSQHMKHINFKHHTSLCDKSDITIDSPNLVSFRFEGSPLLKISMNVKNLLEAYMTLSPISIWRWRDGPVVVYDKSWYSNLLGFLSNLNCSNKMCLRVYSEEALIIPDELRRAHDALLPTVKHLKVTTHRPLLRNSDLQDSLLWAFPCLETLQVDQRTS